MSHSAQDLKSNGPYRRKALVPPLSPVIVMAATDALEEAVEALEREAEDAKARARGGAAPPHAATAAGASPLDALRAFERRRRAEEAAWRAREEAAVRRFEAVARASSQWFAWREERREKELREAAEDARAGAEGAEVEVDAARLRAWASGGAVEVAGKGPRPRHASLPDALGRVCRERAEAEAARRREAGRRRAAAAVIRPVFPYLSPAEAARALELNGGRAEAAVEWLLGLGSEAATHERLAPRKEGPDMSERLAERRRRAAAADAAASGGGPAVRLVVERVRPDATVEVREADGSRRHVLPAALLMPE